MIPMDFLSLHANRFQTIAVRGIADVLWLKTLNMRVFQVVVSSFWSQERAATKDSIVDESSSARKTPFNP